MQTVQLVLPALATVALGTALLVPLRDDRRGRRATHDCAAPLRPDFRAIAPNADASVCSLSESGASNAPITGADPADADFEEAVYGGFHDAVSNDDDAATRLRASFGRRLEGYSLQARRACFHSWRSLCAMLRSSFSARNELSASRSADEEPVTEVKDDTLVERSFAGELAELFGVGELSEFKPKTLAADETPTETNESPPPSERNVRRDASPLIDDAASLVAASDETAADAVIIETTPALCERVVPLTRLPLRPHARDITWALPVGASTGPERHVLLEAMRNRIEPTDVALLVAAYRQEEGAERTLALRALAERFSREARATFIDALHVGGDEERALAIDALAASGAREALVPAFGDRVEAIAARAALAYVGTTERADYVRALGERVDAARLKVILGLLAGLVK